MSKTCSVCIHEQRHEVDRLLVARTPYRKITERFGLSQAALSRHLKAHLPQKLALAEKTEQAIEADRLLWDLRRLQQHTLKVLLDAEKTGDGEEDERDPHLLLKAVAEARRNTELMLKASGDLTDSPTVNISLSVSQEWTDLRTRIIRALEPHPEARESVLRALETS